MAAAAVFSWMLLLLLLLIKDDAHCQTIDKVATIDTSVNISWVEDYFISVTFDSVIFPLDSYYELGLDLSSPKFRTLLGALSPAILRIGGTPADYLYFNKDDSILAALGFNASWSMSEANFDLLVDLTRSTGNRLLFEFNLQFRYGYQWDPSNAMELFQYCADKGYGYSDDLLWEVGNEPERYGIELVNLTALTPDTIANDYLLLHTLIGQYPNLANNWLVGPAIGMPDVGQGVQIATAVANKTGNLLKGLTFHHYYFDGSTTSDATGYLDPTHFPTLQNYIQKFKDAVAASQNPNVNLWLGETSDAYNHGTPNVSNRFASGFLWMDKLGLAATMGVRVVMRQTIYGYNYALLDLAMDPHPDYWLTWLHNRLVGSLVFSVTLSPAEDLIAPTTRAYAHCTNTAFGYEPGTVTFFALNVDQVNSKSITFGGNFNNLPYHQYLLTPNGPDGVLSNSVNLNGVPLEMVSDTEMPIPNLVAMDAGSPVVLEPLTFGYFVFPDAQVLMCT